MATEVDIDMLKNEVQLLRSRVEQIENSKAADIGVASSEELAAVHQLTVELFGIEPIFKVQHYVECEGSYVVVEVPAIGTEEEISKRSAAWHQRMANELSLKSPFSLSLQFRQ